MLKNNLSHNTSHNSLIQGCVHRRDGDATLSVVGGFHVDVDGRYTSVLEGHTQHHLENETAYVYACCMG